MYAKVHKNSNATVYTDELDSNFAIFDHKGKGTIQSFENLLDNIAYCDNLNVCGMRNIDGYGVYVFCVNDIAYFVTPNDLATYQRLGRLHMYAQNAREVCAYDMDIYSDIYEG